MKITFALLFSFALLLLSCSNYQIQHSSKSENVYGSSMGNDQNVIHNSHNPTHVENWAVVVNNDYARIAKVLAPAATPDGETVAVLKLQCLPKTGEGDSVVSFHYEVFNPEKVPAFDFEYFKRSDTPALEKDLVEIKAKTSKGNLDWKFKAVGWYGGFAEQLAFVFSPSSNNKPDKTKAFVRMVADGGAEIKMIAHDHRDNQKVIQTTFPAIDVDGSVATLLKGCVR